MWFRQNYRKETEAIVEETHAKFTKWAIIKHVIVMSLTASIWLIALFLVDLIDFYFISLLWEKELAAAIWYAGSILFFTSSISIGLSITMWALVSKNIWARKIKEAQNFWIVIASLIFITWIIISLLVWLFAPYLLSILWAEGSTLDFAIMYLRIIIIWTPIMALGMWLNAILRAKAEARNAMISLLAWSIVNGILDPILIFWFDLWLKWAAFATLISRFFILWVVIFFLYKNNFFKWVSLKCFKKFKKYLKPIAFIALPAILTNLATPIWNAYVIAKIADFWDSAVAGFSMIWRISPVAFAVIFALSWAIWPIIWQNLWAWNLKRVKQTVLESIKFSVIYIFSISIILFLVKGFIVDMFKLTWEARVLWILFFTFLSWLFIFQALVFIANAAFNNIWQAKKSTIVNFLKATVFTIPFVYFWAKFYGASWALIWQSIWFILIWIIAITWCFSEIKKLNWVWKNS